MSEFTTDEQPKAAPAEGGSWWSNLAASASHFAQVTETPKTLYSLNVITYIDLYISILFSLSPISLHYIYYTLISYPNPMP